jgi:hypothetical protein
MESVCEPEAIRGIPDEDHWRPEIVEFVRHAYRRRPVRWPMLYDELCHMASRGLFRGLGFAELAELGLSFSLCELPKLARLATRVADEERASGALEPDGAHEPVVMELRRPRPVAMAVRPSPPLKPRLTVVRGAAV